MIRLVMTSRTFRQDASWRSEVADPENKLFARGPSYRLDAEVLRDMGLWASQMLDEYMGAKESNRINLRACGRPWHTLPAIPRSMSADLRHSGSIVEVCMCIGNAPAHTR